MTDSPPPASPEPAPIRCGCRRHAITLLSCARCGAPICPDCSRVAPIGMFCRACASNAKGRLYEVSPQIFLLATVVGLAAAIFGGWIVLSIRLGILYNLVVAFAYGTGIGEIVLRMTGRKRGLKMEILAGALPVVGMLVAKGVIFLFASTVTEVNVAALLLNPVAICVYGVAAFGGVNRVRFL